MEHLHLRRRLFRPPFQAMLIRSANERFKQRMRLQRFRLEFGMELATDEVGMPGNFDHLYVGPVWRRPGKPQASRRQRAFVLAIELVAVPMALADLGFPVHL